MKKIIGLVVFVFILNGCSTMHRIVNLTEETLDFVKENMDDFLTIEEEKKENSNVKKQDI